MIVPVEISTYKDEEVVIDDVSITYSQTADCVSNSEDVQSLEISTANNGTARFLVFKTERWAINGIEDLQEIIKDFNTRAGIENKKEGI